MIGKRTEGGELRRYGVQSLKCLLCEPDDLSSIPETSMKNLGAAEYICNPSTPVTTGEAETREWPEASLE